MKRKITHTLSMLLVAMITTTIIGINGVSANPTTIYVDPPSIIDPTMGPGSRFNVTVLLSDVADLFAYQVFLSVNDDLLNITRAWVPSWDPQWVFAGKTTIALPVAFRDLDNDGNNEAVLVGSSILTGTTFTGNGTLAVIEFLVKGKGSSILDVDESNTILEDSLGALISYTSTDGYFENKKPVPPATISVDPSRITDPALAPSNNFNVTVKITNATEVYGFEFRLGFNKTILNIVNASLGDFFPAPPSSIVIKTIDNTAGYILFNASLIPPEPPRNGSGTLAVITFHVEALGESILDLYGAALVDKNNNSLPLNPLEDGYFNNVLQAKLYVDPPEIIDPTLLPGAIFSVDIMIDDVENLYGYEFTLNYSTTMLTSIGLLIHPILNETNFTTNMMVNDDIGQIWVEVQYYSPATPTTTFTPQRIATITFKVDAAGASNLDLYNTRIVDPLGSPIPHQATDGFVMTVIRDVAIVNVVPSATWVYKGWTVLINVTAKNLGNTSETFDVKAYYNSNLIGTQPVTDLPPNAETTLTFSWNTTYVAEGNYTIKGEATSVPFEVNTTNNVYIDGQVEVILPVRDIAILNVTTSETEIYQGWPVNITVTAKNEGNLTETFNVRVFYNSNLIETRTVTDLGPEETVTLAFTWNTTAVTPCSNYTISANATILPFEVDTADNTFIDGSVKVKMMGDINGDGEVDIRDLSIIARAFGSYPGHPRWNPDADLNKDNEINIRDISLAARNFGKTCSK